MLSCCELCAQNKNTSVIIMAISKCILYVFITLVIMQILFLYQINATDSVTPETCYDSPGFSD